MTCRCTRQLARYHAGALPPAQQEALDRHLPACAVCRRELAALQRTADLLAPMVAMNAPAATWPAVQARLRPRRSRASSARQWAPVFAAALILLVIAGALLPALHHGGLLPGGDSDSYTQVQLAAAWDTPLADKAALGLALLASDDELSLTEAVD